MENKSENFDPNKVPFELHITVPNVSDIDTFRNACQKAGVKPIFLELEIKGAEIPDVMTSSKHLGNGQTILDDMEKISQILIENGFNPIRKKIETVPWHSMAPQVKGDKMPPDCYFETHVGLAIKYEDLENLRSIAEKHNVHLSRNAFKKIDGDTHVRMCTLRSYNQNRNDFNIDRDKFIECLKENSFNIIDIINEFAMYDTNTKHDAVWLTT